VLSTVAADSDESELSPDSSSESTPPRRLQKPKYGTQLKRKARVLAPSSSSAGKKLLRGEGAAAFAAGEAGAACFGTSPSERESLAIEVDPDDTSSVAIDNDVPISGVLRYRRAVMAGGELAPCEGRHVGAAGSEKISNDESKCLLLLMKYAFENNKFGGKQPQNTVWANIAYSMCISDSKFPYRTAEQVKERYKHLKSCYDVSGQCLCLCLSLPLSPASG
jgi:hypothetical protein